jgi:hypothetical protein
MYSKSMGPLSPSLGAAGAQQQGGYVQH